MKGPIKMLPYIEKTMSELKAMGTINRHNYIDKKIYQLRKYKADGKTNGKGSILYLKYKKLLNETIKLMATIYAMLLLTNDMLNNTLTRTPEYDILVKKYMEQIYAKEIIEHTHKSMFAYFISIKKQKNLVKVLLTKIKCNKISDEWFYIFQEKITQMYERLDYIRGTLLPQIIKATPIVALFDAILESANDETFTDTMFSQHYIISGRGKNENDDLQAYLTKIWSNINDIDAIIESVVTKMDTEYSYIINMKKKEEQDKEEKKALRAIQKLNQQYAKEKKQLEKENQLNEQINDIKPQIEAAKKDYIDFLNSTRRIKSILKKTEPCIIITYKYNDHTKKETNRARYISYHNSNAFEIAGYSCCPANAKIFDTISMAKNAIAEILTKKSQNTTIEYEIIEIEVQQNGKISIKTNATSCD